MLRRCPGCRCCQIFGACSRVVGDDMIRLFFIGQFVVISNVADIVVADIMIVLDRSVIGPTRVVIVIAGIIRLIGIVVVQHVVIVCGVCNGRGGRIVTIGLFLGDRLQSRVHTNTQRLFFLIVSDLLKTIQQFAGQTKHKKQLKRRARTL
ncbi:hypothetical protein TW95_gp0784 [Pandoravirus inopinatum]|uniref:Uncharacterized protein n=1 Tax=Pandoravirus inopinatum TaxID=1605721 RepID=A0A0B5IXL3_9VIRU|nr:hypothetical protein TW95_gp0784 [Pandoravirus inopinatum]AJF97518.1 hypothetical protein [Pandoravirus inopinatum]